MAPAKVTVADALEKIQSERLKQRESGLADLKHVLDFHRKNPRLKGLEKLQDPSIHTIFDGLFRLNASERANYLKAEKVNTSAARLSNCASVFRLAVETTVQLIGFKTVKALVGHIIQILPTSDGLCQPLCFDYLKALRVILEYQPHVEHFTKTIWTDTLDFCFDNLHSIEGTGSGVRSENGSFNPASFRNTTSNTGPSFRDDSRELTAEFVECLRCLCQTSNCPLLEKSTQILDSIIEFFRKVGFTPQTRQSAFKIINAVLARVSLSSRSQMKKAVEQILPLIRELWPQNKASNFRDEMLITLIHCKSYLASCIAQSHSSLVLDIEGLVEVMRKNYFEKKVHLELEDIRTQGFFITSHEVMPMQTKSFALSNGAATSEHNWSLLHILAFFCCWLDKRSMITKQSYREENPELSPKRRRILSKLEEILQKTTSSQALESAYALQILLFVVEQRILFENEMQDAMQSLLRSASHENPLVSSWAMLCISACAQQNHLRDDISQHLWNTAWHLAARLMCGISTAKSACHALNSLLITERVTPLNVSDTIEAMISAVSLNGPAALSDAALSLWSNAFAHRQLHAPGTVDKRDYEQMISWLFHRWAPSSFDNRIHANQISREISISELLRVLSSSDRLASSFERVPFTILGTIGQAWLNRWETRELVKYLLLLDDDSLFPEWIVKEVSDTLERPQALGDQMFEGEIMTFLSSEVEKTIETWKDTAKNRPFGINHDMVSTVFSFCLTSIFILSGFTDTYPQRANALKERFQVLTKAVLAFASNIEYDQNVLNAVLESVTPFLPNFESESGIRDLGRVSRDLGLVAAEMIQAAKSRRNDIQASESQVHIDSEDMDMVLDSQVSLASRETSPNLPRIDLAARTSETALLASTENYLVLLSHLSDAIDVNETPNLLPARFVNEMTELSSSSILACRPLFQIIMASPLRIRSTDADKLFELIETIFLEAYEFERCEVAIAFLLDLMTGTVHLWSDANLHSLADHGADVYLWLIDKVLSAKIASPLVEAGITDMLFRLLDTDPDYVPEAAHPSIRTTLFGIMEDCDLSVLHHISQRLPELFNRFVLNQHDFIFEDVQERLPRDLDKIDSLCLRLLVLSRLAASWKTLLRRCLYHIFETAGLVVEVAPHALLCIKGIVKALQLSDAHELFRLFSPQLLFTWLKSQNIESIPYAAFGYGSLKDLVVDALEEILSQLVMTEAKDRLLELESIMGESQGELLKTSFGRAAAYGIAKDISTPAGINPEGGNVASHFIETYMRDSLGRAQYLKLLEENYPTIIGHLFCRLEQEDQVEKALSKKPGYREASTTLKNIKNFCSSDSPLPASQQPSFKSKHLLDQIERINRRLHLESSQIWSPFVICQVARMLVNDAHDVFGPLHQSRIIQRLRLLVALTGKTALKGYPLEMLLHAIRPYITNYYCADNAIGLFQYLLEAGKSHLSESPSFIGGICVATALSVRRFLESSPDRTTQESEYRIILGKVQAFQNWLKDYARAYESFVWHAERFQKLHLLMESACSVQNDGNATQGSAESTLLLRLLDDWQSCESVLNPTYFSFCFQLLCQDFSAPVSFREDVLGDGNEAFKYANAIWKSCFEPGLGQDYVKWALRAIGRAFASTGNIPQDITRERRLSYLYPPEGRKSKAENSKETIVLALVQLLQSVNPVENGIVEYQLQQILSKGMVQSNITEEIDIPIPERLVIALSPHKPAADVFRNRDSAQSIAIGQVFSSVDTMNLQDWVMNLAVALTNESQNDILLQTLSPALENANGLANQIFPQVLHLTLLEHWNDAAKIRNSISAGFRHCLTAFTPSLLPHKKVLLNALLYLHSQPVPKEITHVDRKLWLNLNYMEAALAAKDCAMYKSALYFIELSQSNNAKTSRRSSASNEGILNEDLLSIYREIDEPDSFYGVDRSADLAAIADKLDFEGDGMHSLLIRGAESDGRLRHGQSDRQSLPTGIMQSLSKLSLNGLILYLGMNSTAPGINNGTADKILKAATRLRKWDIPVPSTFDTNEGSMYRCCQNIFNLSTRDAVPRVIDTGLLEIFNRISQPNSTRSAIKSALTIISGMTETDDILATRDPSQLQEIYEVLHSRESWMPLRRFEDVSMLLMSRETIFGMISNDEELQKRMQLNAKACRLVEVVINLQASALYREIGAPQESLHNVTYLEGCVTLCAEIGLQLDAAVKQEMANVLWDRNEIVPSIRMLKDIQKDSQLENQAIPVSRASLFATLGKRISDARLEKPDEILNNYLTPALKSLANQNRGEEAGGVFHEYAIYCHNQLRNPDNVEEFRRSEKFQKQRLIDLNQLESAARTAKTDQERHEARTARGKAKQWYDIDNREYRRLRKSREQFLQQSLANYIRCLAATDKYDTDVLRFVALWLEYSSDDAANGVVKRLLGQVPTWKFASLINQLASRLQDVDELFQTILHELVLSICLDHPFHGMHNIFAGSKTTGGHDPAANSRHAATVKITQRLQKNAKASSTWKALSKANELFTKLAKFKSSEAKQGAKVELRKFEVSRKVEQEVPALDVPPITAHIDLRPSLDYVDIPTITGFKPQMTVPSGVSAPKILTTITSDGSSHTELYKGGQDDLRQDAIMEQVFAQVTDLLKVNKATRQRQLRIRTYKVVPLDATSGGIEFVQPTIPLNDFLLTAHHKYHPQELKWSACRKKIEDAHDLEQKARVKVFKDEIMPRFSPVLRHFFFERFPDPDEWFDRRLAYTRSTAAISILGHVLGLGDRHCQNILLDTETGEVIHIDLGVAFEAGRVLRIPEVVPFRLTRDIVDGFGVLKTEGVFRRCCEFTLEALRENKDAIMTLLNVLRYDPLYSWSMSPLRAQRMQEEQEKGLAEDGGETMTTTSRSTRSMADLKQSSENEQKRKQDDEVGDEADRALSVVEKKLATGLSVVATVNELIQQATDERNLALLFTGWAAYA